MYCGLLDVVCLMWSLETHGACGFAGAVWVRAERFDLRGSPPSRLLFICLKRYFLFICFFYTGLCPFGCSGVGYGLLKFETILSEILTVNSLVDWVLMVFLYGW
jgi:hypothetical protein